MPRRNRVDPWGDIHAVPERGMFTGNRGCVVNDDGEVVRHHASSLWITCKTKFRDWRWPLARGRRWTPLFFLDEAVALAAGHRPCGFCRRDDYRAYRDAVSAALGTDKPLLAAELNKRLAAERLGRGRGLVRAHDRLLWMSPYCDLPDGTVVTDQDRNALLLRNGELLRFTFGGWELTGAVPGRGDATVLTSPTSVLALLHGYEPALHATIGPG